MRKPIIAGNWKLNKNQEEARTLASELAKGLDNLQAEAIIFPTFTSLATAAESIEGSPIKLGAQNFCQFNSGAYTGEISIEMLKEIGVKVLLIGHSERREIFNEDDSVINAKLSQALKSGLEIILCCGESLETREAGKTDEWVKAQIEKALENNEISDFNKFTIAYEPIWAIGTGKTCDSAEANRVIKIIRDKVKDLLGDSAAEQIRILYGGSVKPSSIEEQMAQSDIDGALVGGASLKAGDFLSIISGASLSQAV